MKNNIPVTNEQPIILSDGVPSGGGSLEIEHQTAIEDGKKVLTKIIASPQITYRTPDDCVAVNGDIFSGTICIDKLIFSDNCTKVNGISEWIRGLNTFSKISEIDFGHNMQKLGNYSIVIIGTSLKKVYLPKTITELAENAIYYAGGDLEDVYFDGTEEEFNAIFNGITWGGATIHYNAVW